MMVANAQRGFQAWWAEEPGRHPVADRSRTEDIADKSGTVEEDIAAKSSYSGMRMLTKLDRARSRLYRSQILQENMRLKALAEIYTMHSFAQLCNLNFFVKFDRKRHCRTVQNSELCRSRRELSNAYLLGKFCFDTAENEPCQICHKGHKYRVCHEGHKVPRCRPSGPQLSSEGS